MIPITGLALLLPSCSPTRPPVPQELASAESLPVKRKVFILFSGEKLHFGPFAVEHVRRDDDQSMDVRDYPEITSQASQSYTFRLDGAADGGWKGDCRSASERQSRVPRIGGIREQRYQSTLRCDLRAADTGAVWKMFLVEADTSGRILRGILTDGNSSLDVEGTREREGKKPSRDSHTGFEFRDGEQALGEVIRTRGEKVLFHSELEGDRKAPLAAAAAALLLYRDPSQKMEDMVKDWVHQDQSVSL